MISTQKRGALQLLQHKKGNMRLWYAPQGQGIYQETLVNPFCFLFDKNKTRHF